MKNKTTNYKIEPNEMDWKPSKINGFSGKDFIQLSNGEVKLIKINPMSFYPEHIHPDKTEYAYIIEGNPEIQIDTQFFSGKPGDFFVFPNNTNHSIKNNTSTESLVLIGSIKMNYKSNESTAH